MALQVIAFDLDDTLALTSEAIVAHASQLLGMKIQLGDISSDAYWQRYGISPAQAIKLVYEFGLAGYPGLKPQKGAVDVVRRLVRSYELHIVTSRDPVERAITEGWIIEHFSDSFRTIILAGNPYINQTFRSKSTLCTEIGADILVDDNISHLMDCLRSGTRGLLFGGYHWQAESDKLPKGITQIEDWAALGEFFNVKI